MVHEKNFLRLFLWNLFQYTYLNPHFKETKWFMAIFFMFYHNGHRNIYICDKNKHEEMGQI